MLLPSNSPSGRSSSENIPILSPLSSPSPFARCFAISELLLLLSFYIQTPQDLCSLASTCKGYYGLILPLAMKNIYLKDLTRIHSLALLFKRVPFGTVFAACRSLEIGEFTGEFPKSVESQIYLDNPQFLAMKRALSTGENEFISLRQNSLREMAIRKLHRDLAFVFENMALSSGQARSLALCANHPCLRRFSWVGRKCEPNVGSDHIAEALSRLSINLDTLHLTIQHWELSFWMPLFLNTSCRSLKSLHLFILDQNPALPLKVKQALGNFIVQQTKLVDLRLKLPKQNGPLSGGLDGTYPTLRSVELDSDADLGPSTFLSRHSSLVRVKLHNLARTLPLSSTGVPNVRAIWLDHTQRWDFESIHPWFQAILIDVQDRKWSREIVHLRMNVDTEIEHSTLASLIPGVGHSLRCLELVLDRSHFRWSLPQLGALLQELPRLMELGFILHSRWHPWHEWLNTSDLVSVLERTEALPCLLGIRFFDDDDAHPLSSPICERTAFAPHLRYIKWETRESTQLYQIKRTTSNLLNIKELGDAALSRSRSEPDIPSDWTDESLFDHVRGDYVGHDGQNLVNEQSLSA